MDALALPGGRDVELGGFLFDALGARGHENVLPFELLGLARLKGKGLKLDRDRSGLLSYLHDHNLTTAPESIVNR